MATPDQANNPTSPMETAQAFWEPWVTDYGFYEGIADPMPTVLGRLNETNNLRGAAAQNVAQKALEATLDNVQQLQKAMVD